MRFFYLVIMPSSIAALGSRKKKATRVKPIEAVNVQKRRRASAVSVGSGKMWRCSFSD